MDELDGDPGLDRATITGRSELGGEESEKGSIPLAAGGEEVLGDVGETGVVGGRRLVEASFDVCHAFPDAGEGDQTRESSDMRRRWYRGSEPHR